MNNQLEIRDGKSMTICIATICAENSALVLASDCMITNSGLSIQFEHSRKKMTQLSDHCVALTAGDALAHTELFNMVQTEIDQLKSPTVVEVVAKIKDCYQTIRKDVIIESILKPRGFETFEEFYQAQQSLIPDVAMPIQGKIEKFDYGLQILVAGMAYDTAHIYGISNPGISQCFDSLGFHAIGSGMRHAIDTFITRGCNQGASLEDAFLMVYGAKKIAEKAPGVGGNLTDMSIIDTEKIYLVPRDKIKEELNPIYEKWIERDLTWKDDIKVFIGDIKNAE